MVSSFLFYYFLQFRNIKYNFFLKQRVPENKIILPLSFVYTYACNAKQYLSLYQKIIGFICYPAMLVELSLW